MGPVLTLVLGLCFLRNCVRARVRCKRIAFNSPSVYRLGHRLWRGRHRANARRGNLGCTPPHDANGPCALPVMGAVPCIWWNAVFATRVDAYGISMADRNADLVVVHLCDLDCDQRVHRRGSAKDNSENPDVRTFVGSELQSHS